MDATGTFSDFRRRVGSIPFGSVLGEAWGCLVAFLLIYGLLLIFIVPAGWIVGSATRALGFPARILGYLLTAAYLLWVLTNWKVFLAAIEQHFTYLREARGWRYGLYVSALILAIIAFLWMPMWLAIGLLLALDFFFAFLGTLDRLGQAYSAPDIEEIITLCIGRLECASDAKDLFEAALDKVLRLVHERIPPEYTPESRAFAITDAISVLALGLKDRMAGRHRLGRV